VTAARDVVTALGMRAHPEGGWYAETWRAPAPDGERPSGSAIVYLLEAGERSHWHRLDAPEVWHYSAGQALELRTWTPGDAGVGSWRLGPDVIAGDAVQAIVPAGAWQTARPLGSWTLVGCIVAPAFEFDGWELAPDGWEPPL
jgi:predicted cupin superfamily sugar epimerase